MKILTKNLNFILELEFHVHVIRHASVYNDKRDKLVSSSKVKRISKKKTKFDSPIYDFCDFRGVTF